MLCSISAFAQKRITFKIEKLSTPENFLYLQSYDDIYKRLIMSETEVFSKEVEKQEKNPPFNIIAKSEAPDKGSCAFFASIRVLRWWRLSYESCQLWWSLWSTISAQSLWL